MGLETLSLSQWLIGATAPSGLVVAASVLLLGALDVVQRMRHRPTHLLFACVIGTALSVMLLSVGATISLPGWKENTYLMALLVVCVWIAWKALFGPWDSDTKAAMLGTFLFWIAFRMFLRDDPDPRLARMIATLTALVPAFVWCRLFLQYHKERMQNVLIAFFAGMLSTAPVLFYDALVTRNIELQFFLFRIVPESFHRSTESFVTGALTAQSTQAVVIVSLLSFVLVGVLEELSKYWVLRHSCRTIATSIDDVLQLSIIVAIGFAFAENVINPVYFTGFVREYLLGRPSPDILGFLSNVLGRSVLTTMVHVVSTGILGYFLGVSLYAHSYLAELRQRGRVSPVAALFHRFMGIPEEHIFRTQVLLTGILLAIASHGVFNFLVTLPDILPGNPKNIGDVFGLEFGLLKMIPFLLIPAMLYVVGGFWLLTGLFVRADAMKERGTVEDVPA